MLGYYTLYPLESSVELMMLSLTAITKTNAEIAFSLLNKIVPNRHTHSAHTHTQTHTYTYYPVTNDMTLLGPVSLFANTNYLISSSATDFSRKH